MSCTVAARGAASLLGAVTLAVALAGCSDGAQEAPTEPAPLDALFDLVMGEVETDHGEIHRRTEELIAPCMAERGFEYIPVPVPSALRGYRPGEIDTSTLEFAEEYGYRMAADPLRLSYSAEDPNLALIAQMSETELAAYEYALSGPNVPYDELDPDRPDEERGCGTLAGEVVLKDKAATDPVAMDLHRERVRIDYELVPIDPRVTELDPLWAECMEDAGYPGYTAQPEARQRLLDEYNVFGEEGPWGDDGMPALPEGWAEAERALAVVDWRCADAVGYHARVAQVRNDYQQRYLDSHREELEAWVDTWAD